MKTWLKISISLLLVLVSLATIWLIKIQKISVTATGNFILTVGSSVGIIAGVGIAFSTLIPFIRQAGKEKEAIEEKGRKDASSEFFEGLVNHLYKISKNPSITEDEIKSVIDDAKKATNYGVKPAKWFIYASFKSVRYVIEYLSKENHVAAMRRMIEEGTPAHVIGKYLKNHVLEHYQIKDSRDIYLAEKYLK